MTIEFIRKINCKSKNVNWSDLLTKEWLATNALGGYASGTIIGVPTRRYHGLLIAALPAPLGRMVMLNHLSEALWLSDGRLIPLSEEIRPGQNIQSDFHTLAEFRLEMGLPVWRYEVDGIVIEKRVALPHMQNTIHIDYRLIAGPSHMKLRLRPSMHFRRQEAAVDDPIHHSYKLTIVDDQYEFSSSEQLPPLRICMSRADAPFTFSRRRVNDIYYMLEASRGYPGVGELWTPGFFEVELEVDNGVAFIASTENWETIRALTSQQVFQAEHERRGHLLAIADLNARSGLAAELVLAADQFIITPAGRIEEAARARALGDEVRTVIAGYHWFTDWGRDTMISLEGLTLTTGRTDEAGYILRTFAHYVNDGLIPNMFPEGEKEGLYHTADATLWFFHALDRYVETTGDYETLQAILPTLIDIVDHHIRGTRFGIHVDPADGLLVQGEEGYQLTWMDAKVDGWVVTPRRGKAVEINALWYNALSLLNNWVQREKIRTAHHLEDYAARAKKSFNERFWYEEGGYLYDVIDGEQAVDSACRPNQILALSLKHAVLNSSRWREVVNVVRERLLTPIGLRSLAPGHADYKPFYDGDLHARDAAYHQGTVWSWLIGPFIDAWLKVYPHDKAQARLFLAAFDQHLNEACIGSVSEIFDAQEPYVPRGCIAQAWGVAEVLRCWLKTAQAKS